MGGCDISSETGYYLGHNLVSFDPHRVGVDLLLDELYFLLKLLSLLEFPNFVGVDGQVSDEFVHNVCFRVRDLCRIGDVWNNFSDVVEVDIAGLVDSQVPGYSAQ